MQLTVGNQVFNYPDPGTEAGWGEDATGWAEAVTQTLAALISPGDILPTTLQITNNAISDTPLVGLSFNRSVVRAANVSYHVSRKSTGTEEIVESGTLMLTAELTSAISPIWTMTQQADNDAGIYFVLSDSGQISYRSTDIGAAGYTGTIRFSAKTLTVG